MIEKKINTSESSDSISEEEMLRRLGITENNLAGFSDLKVVPDPDEGGFVVSYPTCPDALPAVKRWNRQSQMHRMQKSHGLLPHWKMVSKFRSLIHCMPIPASSSSVFPEVCTAVFRNTPSAKVSA